MTPNELRSELARLGISQVAAGRVLGVYERTIRRWAAGKAPIPRAVELLLERLTPEEAAELAAQP